MLMALDLFVFSLPTLAYQELQRQTSWKHRTTARVGTRDANQFLGIGDDTVTLNGSLIPEITGTILSLDILRKMGNAGDAYTMVDGAGYVYGAFVIESLDETHTYFNTWGQARKVEFRISLRRVDDELSTSYSAKIKSAAKAIGGQLGKIEAAASAAIGKVKSAIGEASAAIGSVKSAVTLPVAEIKAASKEVIGKVTSAIKSIG